MKKVWLLIALLNFCIAASASNDINTIQEYNDTLSHDTLSVVTPLQDSLQSESPTPIHDKNYWFKELKRGKIHFNDKSVYYPSLISWTWNAFKYINNKLNNFDTTYVKGTGKNFKLTLKNNNWFDDYDYSLDDTKVKFHSNITCNLGAYLSILGISGGYEISTERLKGRGNKSKKFELSFTCARFSIEYFRMVNWGDMTMTFISKDGEKLTLKDFSGIKRKMWGINAYYFFNNRHYSQAAVYGFSKRQLRNAGSLLSGISASHCNFTVLNYYLPDYLLEGDENYDEDDEDTLFDYTDVSINVGYGYNWAISHRFLLNLTGLIYTGVKHANRKSESDGGKTFWALNGKLRLGFIYNHGNFFGGIHGYLDSHFFNTGPYRFNRYLCDFSIIAGVQF